MISIFLLTSINQHIWIVKTLQTLHVDCLYVLFLSLAGCEISQMSPKRMNTPCPSAFSIKPFVYASSDASGICYGSAGTLTHKYWIAHCGISAFHRLMQPRSFEADFKHLNSWQHHEPMWYRWHSKICSFTIITVGLCFICSTQGDNAASFIASNISTVARSVGLHGEWLPLQTIAHCIENESDSVLRSFQIQLWQIQILWEIKAVQ